MWVFEVSAAVCIVGPVTVKTRKMMFNLPNETYLPELLTSRRRPPAVCWSSYPHCEQYNLKSRPTGGPRKANDSNRWHASLEYVNYIFQTTFTVVNWELNEYFIWFVLQLRSCDCLAKPKKFTCRPQIYSRVPGDCAHDDTHVLRPAWRQNVIHVIM